VPRFRILVAVQLSIHTPSWRGAWISTGTPLRLLLPVGCSLQLGHPYEGKISGGGIRAGRRTKVLKLSLCLTKYYLMKMYPLIKHHAMETYLVNGVIVPRILNLGTRWR
jgi:hypothetical protein